jgi:hypothetical protein
MGRAYHEHMEICGWVRPGHGKELCTPSAQIYSLSCFLHMFLAYLNGKRQMGLLYAFLIYSVLRTCRFDVLLFCIFLHEWRRFKILVRYPMYIATLFIQYYMSRFYFN